MRLDNLIVERPNKAIYRDGNYAIKLMNPEYKAADVLNEALNLAIVHEAGVRVPALHEVTKIDDRWAIVCDFIEGKTMAALIEENKSSPEQVKALFERFVDIQLDMHKHAANRLRHLSDKMHQKISDSGLDATVRYELHVRLEGIPKRKDLCHGDFIPGNVIITPGGEAYIIDWAHATQGTHAADAARSYLRSKLAGHDEYAEQYLKIYCKKSDTPRQHVEKWLAILSASQLVKDNPEEREFLLRWTNFIDFQ